MEALHNIGSINLLSSATQELLKVTSFYTFLLAVYCPHLERMSKSTTVIHDEPLMMQQGQIHRQDLDS